jgi:transcriptional regulator with XRE-family HTH domain
VFVYRFYEIPFVYLLFGFLCGMLRTKREPPTTEGGWMARVELGERIASLREEQALTQVELANRARISPSTLSLIESGKVPRPHVGTVRKIARALGVEPQALRKEEEVVTPKALAAPPSLDWAETASEEEYDNWIQRASAPELHKVWIALSRVAAGMEEGEKLRLYAGRIQKAVDQFMRLEGPPTGIKPRRTRASDVHEEQESREVG